MKSDSNMKIKQVSRFITGQNLTKDHAQKLEQGKNTDDLPLHKRFILRHRRIIGLIGPALLVHFFWWGIMIEHNLWHLFSDKYFMTITMVFGSLVAGEL